ncbi:hypothetical protein [Streptomyces antarcticus]|uniref:hypothetical protein n=1 Tax=Streptomyces antarcticus TaxID=2996458 RepID=UPI002270E720|nr:MULTISPECIES: hypothetical protein [unclassified Streptomyces]MCY0941429.1 hypothetical protein [Streptomyces sp. H34-AA3]MCZ4085057.1 hypothetical protein [Streptomyces sp. H34-S5]
MRRRLGEPAAGTEEATGLVSPRPAAPTISRRGALSMVGLGSVALARPRVSVNYVRVPAFVSGVLLLVWWPLVLRRVDHFTTATALPADGFLPWWLLITAALFAASAAVLIVRTRQWSRAQRQARSAAK